jgi:hypothetical protein
MIPEAKYSEMILGLLKKTREGTARWEETDEPKGAFLLKLPRSIIILVYRSPRTEPDCILFTLFNHDGRLVGERLIEEEESKDWGMAKELYLEVTHQVTGWDKVLADIEEFISAEKKPLAVPVS